MGKRELKSYLNDLSKAQLIEQIEDLYGRFKEVKTFYDFSFNPQEQKLLEEAKLKISKEYFPVSGRKAKARRSVAQKIIKHYITLGVDVPVVADIMFYNIEIAQVFAANKTVKLDAFYKSMLTSFCQAIDYVKYNGYFNDYKSRIEGIAIEAENQRWINYPAFKKAMITE